MEKRVTIIRHAVALKNLEDRHGGTGSNLAPIAVQEIQELVGHLKAKEIQAGTLFYSPVMHAEETAHFMAELLSSRAEASHLIRPLNFGLVAGLRTAEVKVQFPDVAYRLEQWRAGQLEAIDLDLPEAESFPEFWQRGITFLRCIPEGQNIVVGTRSVLVLLGNILRGRTLLRGGGYKEIPVK